MSGFIKLYRKLLGWGWYQDSVVKDLFLHLLLTASFKDFVWLGKQFKAGQLITGRKKLAQELNFSEQQIRTAIKKLKSTGEIEASSTNKYTVITVINWKEYQGFEDFSANKQPHIKNIKNNKNNPLVSPLKKGGRKKREAYGCYDLDAFERMLNTMD